MATINPERSALLLQGLVARAEATGCRQIVGIVGAPGTGKSTFAEHALSLLPPHSGVIVPMDGFHLASNIIDGTHLHNRRGAIDTFDGAGYLHLLRRIRDQGDEVIYAPSFRRGLEEPIAASIAINPRTRFILTEGNYLLSDAEPWQHVRRLFDESWFVHTPDRIRVDRLIERHVRFGKTLQEATAWANGPDEVNARYVESTKSNAQHVVDWL